MSSLYYIYKNFVDNLIGFEERNSQMYANSHFHLIKKNLMKLMLEKKKMISESLLFRFKKYFKEYYNINLANVNLNIFLVLSHIDILI